MDRRPAYLGLSARADLTGIKDSGGAAGSVQAGLQPQEAQMIRTLVIFVMAVPTLMGSAIVVALSAGFDTREPILIAAAIGFLLAIPVTWFVSRKIAGMF
jgi:hypothetical protein